MRWLGQHAKRRTSQGFNRAPDPRQPPSATEGSLVTWRIHIGDDVIQDMDGSAKSFSSATQAMCSIKCVSGFRYRSARAEMQPARRPQQQAHRFSTVTVTPVSNGPPRACCLKGLPQSRYFFEGWAFGSDVGVATDSAAILVTDCWRASNFSVSVAICFESFFVSACWAASCSWTICSWSTACCWVTSSPFVVLEKHVRSSRRVFFGCAEGPHSPAATTN